jgi:hypothetical protein
MGNHLFHKCFRVGHVTSLAESNFFGVLGTEGTLGGLQELGCVEHISVESG